MTQDPVPSPDDAVGSPDDEMVRQVRVSRAPRYPVFLLSGAVVGLIVATVLAAVAPDAGDYSRGTLWGYLLVGLGVVGALLGGLVAIVAERITRPGKADPPR